MKVRKGKIRSIYTVNNGIYIKIEDLDHGEVIIKVDKEDNIKQSSMDKEVYFAIDNDNRPILFIYADEASSELKKIYKNNDPIV